MQYYKKHKYNLFTAGSLLIASAMTGLWSSPSFAGQRVHPRVQHQEDKPILIGPYYNHVQCFKNLQGKSETPNSNSDPEVFLPGKYDNQPGVFWFDNSGQSYFFDLALDLPELEEFRKSSGEDTQWISDVRSMKRFGYKDSGTKEDFRYAFILRVLQGEKFVPLRFVWLKDYDFKTNQDIRYQDISDFNKTLLSMRKKYGRRILSRTMISVARKPIDRSLASIKRGNKHPAIEKILLDELKKKAETVYFSYRRLRSIEHSSADMQDYVSALEQCQMIGDPGLNNILQSELNKFNVLPSTNRGIATSSNKAIE